MDIKKIGLSSIILSLAVFIFIVLSFALYNSLQSETKKRIMLEDKLDQTIIAKDTLQKELDETKGILDETTKAKDDLETRLDTMVKQAQSLAKELAEEKRAKTEALDEIAKKEQQLVQLETDIEDMKKENENLSNMLTKSEKDFKDLQQQLLQIKEAKDALENKVKELVSRKEVNLEKVVVKQETPQAKFKGQVLTVNKEFGFVVINIGQKDGLQAGTTLGIYRDGNLLCKAQVEKLYENMAAATILGDNKAIDIKEGDTVKSL